MNNPRRIQRHLVKAFAAGALLAAAALPLAIATAASAAAPPVLTTFTTSPASIGAGGSGTVAFGGTGFAHDGGNVSLSTTATGVTFSSVVETSTTAGTADITTSATTAPGSYSVTLTDDNGTSQPLAGVLTINADPTVTSISIASVAQSQTTATATITGTGFATGTTATISNPTNGTDLTNTFTYTNATTLTGTVTGTTTVGGHPAAVGSYTITVNNADGGSGSLASAFTVTASGITNVSPSALPQSTTATVTINGAGFEPSATFAMTNCGASTDTGFTVVSPAQATVSITTGTTNVLCTFTITNPSTGNGGNAAVITGTGVFGVGEAAAVAPTVTTATLSPSAPIVVGTSTSTPETLTIAGTGFSQYTTVSAYNGTSTTADGDVTFACTDSAAGTTLTCAVTVANGATAGTDYVEAINTNGGTAYVSNPAAAALVVAGPAIASAAPADLAINAPVGTVITLTGTGFLPSATATVAGGTGLAGTFAVTSPTTATFAVTTSPTSTGTATITVHQTVSAGEAVVSTPFSLPIDALPTVTSLVNTATGTDSFGAGATNVPVTITGTGFETGATLGTFVNAYGVADPAVTFTAGTVTATSITGTLTIASTDVNASDGYTIKNPDGGSVTVQGFVGGKSLFIAAAPTITSVTPASGAASATTSFAIAGTGFLAGATVTLSPANGTCGAATVSSSTTIAVTCTLGKPSSVATSLVVTNTNGGAATSSPVLAAATTTAPAFHVSGVHGAAVAGKWVTVQITGTGFYGQPKITSTAVGSKFAVTKDTGRALTVKIFTKVGLKGEHTLTVHLANGKSGKAGYNIKA